VGTAGNTENKMWVLISLRRGGRSSGGGVLPIVKFVKYRNFACIRCGLRQITLACCSSHPTSGIYALKLLQIILVLQWLIAQLVSYRRRQGVAANWHFKMPNNSILSFLRIVGQWKFGFVSLAYFWHFFHRVWQ